MCRHWGQRGGGHPCSGAVERGGEPGPLVVGRGKQKVGVSWKNGFGAEDTWLGAEKPGGGGADDRVAEG